jgi:hypothetical protein
MKLFTSLLAACVLAMVSLAPAQAADISAPPQPLVLVDNSAGYFGDSFGLNNNGNTFSDQFTFTVGDFPFNVDAIVASISRSDGTGLDISALGLYTVANALVVSGTQVASGAADIWQLSGDLLDPGSYYLQVQGTVVSDGAASYGAAALLTAVPEPAMLGMLAGGLGLMGVAARRRMRTRGVLG